MDRKEKLSAAVVFSIHQRVVICTTFIIVLNTTGNYSSTNALEDERLYITQGIASGDVTQKSAIIWSRVNQEAQMNIEYDTNENFSDPRFESSIADETTNFSTRVRLENLSDSTLYYYRVWFTTLDNDKKFAASNMVAGTFLTAPNHLVNLQIDFIFSGDLGGQGYCRRIDMGYPIFTLIKSLSPDFFIFNGDQVYADSVCPKEGPNEAVGWQNIIGNFSSVDSESIDWNNSTQLNDLYLAHWEYNRNDNHLQGLLSNTSLYSQFDDHEVIDNYGGGWPQLPNYMGNRTGFSNLVKTGIDLFMDFSPIDIRGRDNKTFYRMFDWGRELDLFILDSRSYRSFNNVTDSPENDKTMLGRTQLEWLKKELLTSNSTWKVISTSNAITIPSCFQYGCDSWATNGIDNRTFVTERTELLKFLDDNNIKNVVFTVTDVHFPASILVDQDFNGDGDNLLFHELVTGPLSASPLLSRELDPTLNASYLYRESKIFNFGHISIGQSAGSERGHLVFRVVDDNGLTRPASVLRLSPK